jgi:hypothetical protein
MPILPFVPAIIGAGVGIYSATQAGKAAKDSLNAQNQAAQEQLAAQEAARNQITGLEQPFVSGGTLAEQALARQFGLAPGGQGQGQVQGGGGVGQPWSAGPQPGMGRVQQGDYGRPVPGAPDGAGSTPAAPSPDWDAYLAANPDVAARAQQGQAEGLIGPGKQWDTPENWAQFQYQNTGQSEGRQLPMQPAQPTQATPTTQADPNAPPPTFQGQPVDGAGAPIYTRGATTAAPSQGDYFSNFEASPGYQWRLDQGQRNLNANYGARGLLKSGAAIQGAIDYGQNQASAEYGNWFNRQNSLYNEATNQYNNTNLRNDANFNNDRAYGTNLFTNERDYANNLYNTNTGNLFSLAQMGQNAAGATGNAATNYANQSSNIYGSQANAASAAAQQRASANSSLFGSLGSLASNGIAAAFGSGYSPIPTQTIGSAWGNSLSTTPVSANANFVNPLPSYSYGGTY